MPGNSISTGRDSEEHYRSMLAAMAEGVVFQDADGRIVFCNPSAERILGLTAGEMIGRNSTDPVWKAIREDGSIFPGEEHPAIVTLRTGQPCRDVVMGLRRPDGAVTWLSINSEPLQRRGEALPYSVVTTFSDVTRQRESELVLKQNEERLRLAIDINRMGTFDIFPQAGRRDWSPLTKQFFGFPPDADVTFEDFVGAVHPEDRERVRREVGRLLSPGHEARSFSEFRTAPGIDGQERWVASWGRTFFDENGTPVRLLGIAQDITERKRAEQALRESEARLRLTFDQAPIGAAMVGLDRNFLRVNDALCRFLGYQEHELIGSQVRKVTAPDYRAKDHENVLLLEAGALDQYQTDKLYLRKDGTLVWGHATVRLVKDPSGRALYFMAMVEDISERKRAEEEREKLHIQLLHAQKMESVGRLAGGVAHDFNNLLTVINGYSTLALKRLGDHDPLAEIITEIHKAGEAAAALVRQLLAFGRKQLLRKEAVDLNGMISGMEKSLLPLLGEQIEIRTVLAPSLSSVFADRHQIEQVIMNLAVNARDAMPGGGVLAIETSEVTCGPYCRRCVSPIAAGRYVSIEIRDNGTGMDEQTRQHLFEPFYSTKAPSLGTGLGLATVHGIVLQSGGHIDVESRPGKGTSFYIYLPAAQSAEASATMPKEARPDVPAAGSETILLVEDQPEVRRLTASVLRECGYEVLEAGSAEEGLTQVADRGVDLVLTDVVLPKMNGCDLAEAIRAQYPEAKVLFMSGYSDEILKGQARGIRGATLIQKPFTPGALAEKLRETLRAN